MADLPAAASTVLGLDGADGSGDEEPPLTGLWLGGLSTGSEETLLLPLQNDGPFAKPTLPKGEKISHSHLKLVFKFCKQVLEERGWIIWLRNALQTYVHILTTLYTLSK